MSNFPITIPMKTGDSESTEPLPAGCAYLIIAGLILLALRFVWMFEDMCPTCVPFRWLPWIGQFFDWFAGTSY